MRWIILKKTIKENLSLVYEGFIYSIKTIKETEYIRGAKIEIDMDQRQPR